MPRTAHQSTRRIPRQARAKEMVEYIVTAGLEILRQDGPGGLTVRRIAERAGVSVGSIYQYFHTKDGVTEAVYRRQFNQEWDRGVETVQDLEEHGPLRQAIRDSLGQAAERHLQFYEMAPALYNEHSTRLCVSPSNPESLEAVSEFLRSIMTERRQEFRIKSVEYAVFLVTLGIGAIFRETLRERPEYFRDPEFVEELTAMVCRYLLRGSE
jgi:AcrR family transcriptional regulator